MSSQKVTLSSSRRPAARAMPLCQKLLIHWLGVLILFGVIQTGYAFSWHDLWATKDQQAQVLMSKGQYSEAKDTFERADWRATSAYRAGDYKNAASLYQSGNTEDAYYNQGNALAHLGQYEKALAAYDKALGLNPNHEDAIANRKIVEDLLKQDKQQKDQDKQDQDKQDQDKQDQDKQDQDKQDQDKQDQNKQDQDKQDQDKQNQDKQDQDKQDQDKQDQDKQDQDKQDQDKQDQDKQDQDKQDQDKPASSNTSSPTEKEQAKEQWLRLIPDDPGGLMREKFLRDHLRRQRGWNQ